MIERSSGIRNIDVAATEEVKRVAKGVFCIMCNVIAKCYCIIKPPMSGSTASSDIIPWSLIPTYSALPIASGFATLPPPNKPK